MIKKERLQEIYGNEAAEAEARFQNLTEQYQAKFGGEPKHFFSAPGRTEIIGNHTDHNGGRILAASINLDTICAAAPTDDGIITIISEGYKKAIVVDTAKVEQVPTCQGSVSLVAGIVKAAKEVLKGIYHQGYLYKRAGVIVLGITPDSPLQQDLFDLDAEHIQKFRQLDKVVDRINKRYGTETIVIGSQQYTQKDGKGKANIFANAIKHDFKSPNPTTRWSDIIKLK